MVQIKAILFDLDGVLVNSRVLHYETFRDALQSVKPHIHLSWIEHEQGFDGLSTRLKIKKLIADGVIQADEGDVLFQKKQALTMERLAQTIKPKPRLHLLLRTLQNQGFHLICCSNSIRATLESTLEKAEILSFFERIYSNEDVLEPKPSPEIYTKAMKDGGFQPDECLILEDSPIGRAAAYASRAHVLEIEDAEDLTDELIRQTLFCLQKDQHLYPRSLPKGRPVTYHVVIPMAGEGSRFRDAGFQIPKPFLPVGGKPMVQWVLESMLPKEIPINHYKIRFHLIVRTSHLLPNRLDKLFWDMPPNVSYTYHQTDGLTEGAACSVLLAENEIMNDEPLIIANSDQFMDWNPDRFYRSLLNPNYDGSIVTFYQPNPYDVKWSYAKISPDDTITEVQEKKWISPYATVGIYGWKRGNDFVRYAKEMIAKNIRVKNEFYVCPVYNEAIQDGKMIRGNLCSGMWGLGTPEDLEVFQRNYLKENGSEI